MEKVRGRIRRMRHRFELPACLKPKKDMPSLIYTVLERENNDRSSLFRGRNQHLRRQSSCKESGSRTGSPYLKTNDNCKRVRDDCLGDVSFSWAHDDDGLFCEKESGADGWNSNILADGEGPTIRVATFDVALFSLAPAIPPEHACAVSATPSIAAAAAHTFELTTPSHNFHSSDSSSIFSDKSKSNSSDASSGMNSFSNSRESTDSNETFAILSQHSSKPTQTFNICPSINPPKHHHRVFDIRRVWRSSSPARPKSKANTPKPRTLSPFKPVSGKNNACGNFYHSKLNPVFGLSGSGSSSRCLMDSLPSLFSDLLTFGEQGPDPEDAERSLHLPRHCEEKRMCSSPPFSQLEYSPCNSGFHTPLHPELFPADSGAASPYTVSPAGQSNPISPCDNSACLFDSPCSILSPLAPRFYSGPSETPQPDSKSCTIATSILDILLEVDADIISLQEVRAEEERGMKPLSELADALGMEFAYAESWAPEFGNAVLSRWPIKSASVQQIHDETDYRNVLKVIVEVPLVGDLHVYCTQLDHLDEDWRMKQVDSFLQTLPASQPHILTGNLNSLDMSDYSKDRWEEIAQARKQDRKLSPRGDVLRKLVQEKSYNDAKLAMGEGLMEAGLQLKGQGVDGTCQHGTRVDYILGSSKLPFDFVPGSYSVVSSRGTSNHDLALVDLQPHCFL
ncbi:unnamed protein product [Calypogeia fissa]